MLGAIPTQDQELGNGVVYEISPNGNGAWNEAVIHAFDGGLGVGPDGANPSGPVIFDSAGNLYGVTMYGGKGGANPAAGIVFDPAGNIYGTTVLGGSKNDCFRASGPWQLQLRIHGSLDFQRQGRH